MSASFQQQKDNNRLGYPSPNYERNVLSAAAPSPSPARRVIFPCLYSKTPSEIEHVRSLHTKPPITSFLTPPLGNTKKILTLNTKRGPNQSSADLSALTSPRDVLSFLHESPIVSSPTLSITPSSFQDNGLIQSANPAAEENVSFAMAGSPLRFAPVLPKLERFQRVVSPRNYIDQQDILKPFPSILRKSSYHNKKVNISSLGHEGPMKRAITSVSSDMPSLASTVSCESLGCAEEDDDRPDVIVSKDGAVGPSTDSTQFALESFLSRPETQPLRRCVSEGAGVKFDPLVWVREFSRSELEEKNIWYTSGDLDQFKEEALQRLVCYTRAVPPSLLKVNSRSTMHQKMSFSHPALSSCDDGDNTAI